MPNHLPPAVSLQPKFVAVKGEDIILWKTLCLVLVPKKAIPSGLNDFRPDALMSHVMKVLESGSCPSYLAGETSPDPFQFAYHPLVEVIIYLFQHAHS